MVLTSLKDCLQRRQSAATLEYLEHEEVDVPEAVGGALDDVDLVVDGFGEAVGDGSYEVVEEVEPPALQLLDQVQEGLQLGLASALHPAVEELAGAIERVLRDGDLRAELVARGLTRTGYFSWERAARQTARVYRQAYSGKSEKAVTE